MSTITEYDGYEIELLSRDKKMTEAEKKEYLKEKEEARKKSLEILKKLRED